MGLEPTTFSGNPLAAGRGSAGSAETPSSEESAAASGAQAEPVYARAEGERLQSACRHRGNDRVDGLLRLDGLADRERLRKPTPPPRAR